MKNKKYILLISVLILVSCGSKTKNTVEKTEKDVEKSEEVTTTDVPLIKKIKNNKLGYLNEIVTINGKRFKSLSETLTTSSKLMNVNNSSIGRITGSFIVSSKTKPTPSLLGLSFNNDAQPIAHNTWRFTVNKGEDFLTLDKDLRHIFSKVEMSIKYGDNDVAEQ